MTQESKSKKELDEKRTAHKTLMLDFLLLNGGALLGVAVIGLMLGGVFAVITGSSFITSFLQATKWAYIFAGAVLTEASILKILGVIKSEDPYPYACGLHYGTIIGGYVLTKLFPLELSHGMVIAFIIVALICYIVYIKKSY